MRVEAHHANDEAHRLEQWPGPRRVVCELCSSLIGQDVRVRPEAGEFRRVELFSNRQPPKRVSDRTCGGSHAEIPKLLPLKREDKADKLFGERAVGGPSKDPDRIDANRGPADRREKLNPRRRAANLHRLALKTSVKIDAHSDRRISIRNIDRHKRRAIGEIPGVGGGRLDDLHPARPAD